MHHVMQIVCSRYEWDDIPQEQMQAFKQTPLDRLCARNPQGFLLNIICGLDRSVLMQALEASM
jgi:hypothetical protein